MYNIAKYSLPVIELLLFAVVLNCSVRLYLIALYFANINQNFNTCSHIYALCTHLQNAECEAAFIENIAFISECLKLYTQR